MWQVPHAALAQATPTVTVDECRNLSDADVRDRIRDLAATSLGSELKAIDYQALVNLWWAKADVNGRLDREVDAAIAAVRADTGWFDRAYSTVSKSSAARYATAVSDRTYNSEGFKSALNEMATGVAKDVGTQIEKATAKVSNPIIACVQTALQSRYGGAIAQVFVQESQKNLETNAEQPAVKIETSDLIATNAASISGIVLIVTRRVIAEIVESLGARIAGVVASRLVSAVAGLVGLALIAKDIYDAGSGVFPIIADRMKSDETKNIIRAEVGKTIQADISQQVGKIAQETADRLYAGWLDFKQKYNRLLELSERSDAFANFLKDRRLDQLGKLGQIVDILYATEGEKGILERVGNGSLNKALLDLSDAGLAIAQDQKSIDKALRWTEVAGRDLSKVVELGMYKWLSPESVSRDNLQKILSLNDKVATARIANLSPEARELILNLPADQMRDFTRRLKDRELAAFADYERHLEPAAARRLLRAVAEDPSVMNELSGEGLRQAVLASRDQLAALNMAIHEDAGLISYGRIFKDAQLVRDGTVSYRVFWDRYWVSILVAGFVLLLLLSWLRRLLFSRPQIVIRDQGKTRAR
ncbi:MAG TPA: hypothetical protein VE986_04780 [Hyphomicrobiales bacterium]|nr:hypothetical protein [Hyphomicrobiales bacterium]